MDSDLRYYVSDTKVRIGESELTVASSNETNLSFDGGSKILEKESENVVRLQDGSRIYYLFRDGGKNTSFGGDVKKQTVGASRSASRGLAAVGGIQLVIRNVLNTRDVQTVTTESDGSFAAEAVIPGDAYTVEAAAHEDAEPVSVTLTAAADGASVGTITLTPNRYNIKAWIDFGYSAEDRVHFYPGQTYRGSINIQNVGTQDIGSAICVIAESPGLNLKLIPPNGSSLGPEDRELTLMTIEPGKTRVVEVDLSVDSVNGTEFEDKTIAVRTEIFNDETYEVDVWEDSLAIRFNGEPMDIVVKSSTLYDNPLNGVVLSPDKEAYWFNVPAGGEETVRVPYRETGYMIVLSGASADTEVGYAVGINHDPPSALEIEQWGLRNEVLFEPNDGETLAKDIPMYSSIISYLRKNDIDYFTITRPDGAFTFNKTTIDSGFWAGEECRIILDGQERPSFFYTAGIDSGLWSTRELRYAWKEGETWKHQSIWPKYASQPNLNQYTTPRSSNKWNVSWSLDDSNNPCFFELQNLSSAWLIWRDPDPLNAWSLVWNQTSGLLDTRSGLSIFTMQPAFFVLNDETYLRYRLVVPKGDATAFGSIDGQLDYAYLGLSNAAARRDEKGGLHTAWLKGEELYYAYQDGSPLTEYLGGDSQEGSEDPTYPSIAWNKTNLSALTTHYGTALKNERYLAYCLASDADGQAAIAYRCELSDGYGLVLARKVPQDQWTFELVDEYGNTGRKPVLELDPSGMAHILYFLDNATPYSRVPPVLKYARETVSGWIIQIVDQEVFPYGWTGEYYADLELDSQGRPHICYYKNGDLVYMDARD